MSTEEAFEHDAAARATGRAARRDLRAARTWPARCAWRARRRTRVIVVDLLRRRREVPVRAVLGRRRTPGCSARALTGTVDGARASGRRRGRHPAARRSRRIPNECCGALVRPRRATSSPPSRCRTRPKRVRAAGSSCGRRTTARPSGARRELGAELLGFYHSHPDHPARPSQYDLDHAWPFFSYIIVSVRAGVPEDMTSWRLRDDRSAFDPRRP